MTSYGKVADGWMTLCDPISPPHAPKMRGGGVGLRYFWRGIIELFIFMGREKRRTERSFPVEKKLKNVEVEGDGEGSQRECRVWGGIKAPIQITKLVLLENYGKILF